MKEQNLDFRDASFCGLDAKQENTIVEESRKIGFWDVRVCGLYTLRNVRPTRKNEHLPTIVETQN